MKMMRPITGITLGAILALTSAVAFASPNVDKTPKGLKSAVIRSLTKSAKKPGKHHKHHKRHHKSIKKVMTEPSK